MVSYTCKTVFIHVFSISTRRSNVVNNRLVFESDRCWHQTSSIEFHSFMTMLRTLKMSLMLSIGTVYCSNSTLTTHSCMPARGQTTSRAWLEACIADFVQWCGSRHLQLNADKTETLLVGSRSNITKLAIQHQSLRISSETIKPTTVVRDLGVLLEHEASRHQARRGVPLPPAPSAADPPTYRYGHHHSSRAGHDHITTRLLQLSASRLTVVHTPPLQRLQNAAARVIQCWQAGTRLTVP